MASSFKKGQIVLAQGHGNTTFKVLRVSKKDRSATIQAFNLSKQILLDAPTAKVPLSTLTLHKEDANQAAFRVVREATEKI
jgi:hypothetical protein